MVAELINKYIWIVETLKMHSPHGLLLSEIGDRWENRWQEPFSRKTFHNHRKAIEELFDLEIRCRRSDNRYYLEEADYDSNESAKWMINLFTVNNLLKSGQKDLAGRISVEDIPSGQTHLTAIMNAMLNKHVMKVVYRRYGHEANTYDIHPYGLKEFSKRWYLIGWCEQRSQIRTYALDRIAGLEEEKEEFTCPHHFDIDSHFSGCFGIWKDETAVTKKIVFATTAEEGNYIADLPLHESQVELDKVPEELAEEVPEGMTRFFQIRVAPNVSLTQEFCKHLAGIKVLSPADYREEVRESVRQMADLYWNKNQ